jgi:broad specificity phosphatase PhoE
MQLMIARHAETTWNVERRIQGWTDSPLTTHGTQQARALADRLRAGKIDAIYSSDSLRAIRTAECVGLWHDLEVTPIVHLRESSWGDWEGMTADEISERYPELWPKFVKRGQDTSMDDADWESTTLVPGGESAQTASDRIGVALEQIKAKHAGSSDRVLVVGHGGSLRFIFTHALGIRPIYARRFHVDNTALSEIWYTAHHLPVIHLVNDISHLATEPSSGFTARTQSQ